MKTKIFVATTLISAGIGIGAVSTPTNAATWHKGTPNALRGHWKTGTYRLCGFWNYNTTTISKHMLESLIHAIGSSADASMPTIWHPKYKYMGNHLYKFKGMGIAGLKTHCWIKWQGHNKLLIKTPKATMHYYRR